MKQIQPLSNEQKIVLEVLKFIQAKFDAEGKYYCLNKEDFFQLTKDIKATYGIKEEYKTLRQYIKEKSVGSYHTFSFDIYGKEITVNCISDFSLIYREELLDMFYVVEDKREEH